MPQMGQYKTAPIVIDNMDCIQQIRKQAYRERCDELLGCAALLPLVRSEGQLQLPISATFPDPPDVVFSSDQSNLAIEVFRVNLAAPISSTRGGGQKMA